MLDTILRIACFEGEGLSIDCLTTLDVELATAIAGFKGQWLALDSVASLDPATAKTLAAFGGQDMLLNGLMTLDVATATAQAGSKGTLRLPDLRRISRKTLRVLVEKPDVEIPPIKTLDWIPEWLENGL